MGTFDDVDHTLRAALPKLFLFLDSLTPRSPVLDDTGKALPPYVLCLATGHTLNPAPQHFPDVADIIFAAGGTKTRIPNRIIYIGMSL